MANCSRCQLRHSQSSQSGSQAGSSLLGQLSTAGRRCLCFKPCNWDSGSNALNLDSWEINTPTKSMDALAGGTCIGRHCPGIKQHKARSSAPVHQSTFMRQCLEDWIQPMMNTTRCHHFNFPISQVEGNMEGQLQHRKAAGQLLGSSYPRADHTASPLHCGSICICLVHQCPTDCSRGKTGTTGRSYSHASMVLLSAICTSTCCPLSCQLGSNVYLLPRPSCPLARLLLCACLM